MSSEDSLLYYINTKTGDKFFLNTKQLTNLDNSINRTCFLTETTEDALCHVDIVPRCASTTVSSFFRVNCYSLQQEKLMNIQYTVKHEHDSAFHLDSSYKVYCLFSTIRSHMQYVI
jgi:hypothetical protein